MTGPGAKGTLYVVGEDASLGSGCKGPMAEPGCRGLQRNKQDTHRRGSDRNGREGRDVEPLWEKQNQHVEARGEERRGRTLTLDPGCWHLTSMYLCQIS